MKTDGLMDGWMKIATTIATSSCVLLSGVVLPYHGTLLSLSPLCMYRPVNVQQQQKGVAVGQREKKGYK